jgi:hypothetical protein
MRTAMILMAVSALALSDMGGVANAKTCTDASKHFVKCPAAAPKPGPKPLFGMMKPKPAAPTPMVKAPMFKSPMAKAPAPRGPIVKSVAPGANDPRGATARCKDGTYSHSKSHSGSCSHDGGVAKFL